MSLGTHSLSSLIMFIISRYLSMKKAMTVYLSLPSSLFDMILQISYGTTSSTLSNITIYRNYFRANPPSTTLTPALRALMNRFNWRRIGLLTQDENRFQRVSLFVSL